MVRERPYAQVDVFSEEPYRGNPVAVILDAVGISDDDMARIARWTNLSETTFVLPPSDPAADYQLRIFTPAGELPFAGRPTLGSARAWLENGGAPKSADRIVQQCQAGLVELRRDGDVLSFTAPPLVRTGPLEPEYLERIVAAFGITPQQVIGHQWVDNGPGWAVVQLATAEEVLALRPDFSDVPDAMVGAIGAYPEGSPHAFELRSFAPGVNVYEDPVCGSQNASVAQWLTGAGLAPDQYSVAQGARQGRAGQISIAVKDGDVWVGGATRVLFRGTAIA